jgi:hypothetical protein
MEKDPFGDQFASPCPDNFESFTGTSVNLRSSVHNPFFGGCKWDQVRDHLLQRYSSARKAFQDIDTSNDGSVTLGELQDALDRLRVPWRVMCDCDSIRQLLKGHPKMKDGGFAIHDLFGDEAFDAESDSDLEFDEDYHKSWQAKHFTNLEEVEKFTKWAADGKKWESLYTIFGSDEKDEQQRRQKLSQRRLNTWVTQAMRWKSTQISWTSA